MKSLIKNKNFERFWLALLLLTPFVLWGLPAHLFDESKVIICPSRRFFNVECFGCGMTRAVMHFHHLEIEEAFYFNQGSILVYPALVIVWFFWVYKSWQRLKNGS